MPPSATAIVAHRPQAAASAAARPHRASAVCTRCAASPSMCPAPPLLCLHSATLLPFCVPLLLSPRFLRTSELRVNCLWLIRMRKSAKRAGDACKLACQWTRELLHERGSRQQPQLVRPAPASDGVDEALGCGADAHLQAATRGRQHGSCRSNGDACRHSEQWLRWALASMHAACQPAPLARFASTTNASARNDRNDNSQ